jgi:hypothetical protein
MTPGDRVLITNDSTSVNPACRDQPRVAARRTARYLIWTLLPQTTACKSCATEQMGLA